MNKRPLVHTMTYPIPSTPQEIQRITWQLLVAFCNKLVVCLIDDRNAEYSPSGTSSNSPVSPPHTVSNINSTLYVAGGSVRRFPQAPPSPPPLRPFSQGPRWGLPQKPALNPLATTPSLPPNTESFCWQTVPGNSRTRRSLLRLFLPPCDGHHCRRRRRPGVHQRCCGRCLRGREAS